MQLGGGRASGQVPWTPDPHVQSCLRQRPEWPVWGQGEGRRLGSVSSEATGHAGGPAQELEGLGTRTEGSPHRVADLTLRLGRQPSGPPRACVGLLEAAIPLESPCKPGAVYR